MSDLYREGDFYRTDDRTGRKTRASQMRKEWTGKIVDKDWWEPRQPQDFVRGLHDRQNVPNPRPDTTPTYVGPLKTTVATAAAAGDTTITVASSIRMGAGDSVTIMLDNNDAHRATIASVPDSTSISLVSGLPFAASVGNLIVDTSAISPATLP